MITVPCYCSREDVKGAIEVAETARSNDQVDRAVQAAVTRVETLLQRKFVPSIGTRYFDWPNVDSPTPWILHLNESELVSLTSLTSAGTAISTSNLNLEPNRTGPPYRRIEVDTSTASSYESGSTYQQQIAVTGTFGYRADTVAVGTLSGSLAAVASTAPSVTWTTQPSGVGNLLLVDSEYILITDRSMVDSTQNLGGDLAASTAGVSVSVSDGSTFPIGSILLIDSERMRVVDVAGNTLTVIRAWDGSVLAAHTTGADVYALTGVTTTRAAVGSTLASHSSGATVYQHLVPEEIKGLAVAYAIEQMLQERSGYARTADNSEAERESYGRALKAAETRAFRLGRQIRIRVI